MVPYLDVMLVLLIIFMITAPMTAPMGLQVKLPKANSEPIEVKSVPTSLVITQAGVTKITHGEEEINLQQGFEQLKQWLESRNIAKDQTIYVQADKDLSWQLVLENILKVHKLGWERWALLSTAKDD